MLAGEWSLILTHSWLLDSVTHVSTVTLATCPGQVKAPQSCPVVHWLDVGCERPETAGPQPARITAAAQVRRLTNRPTPLAAVAAASTAMTRAPMVTTVVDGRSTAASEWAN